MNYYIGIDLSLTNTGIIVLNSEGHLVDQHSIKPKSKGDERLVEIKTQLHYYLSKYDEPFSICIEGYSYGSKNRGLPFQIGELGGVIKSSLFEKGLQYKLVPPTTMKKFITGKGNAKKEEIQSSIKQKWGIEFTDNNLADAYGLARVCLGEGVL